MMVAGGEGEEGDNAVSNLESLGGSNMAPFLTKLFQIVSAGATDQCIKWTPKGDSFVISDPDSFARDILPTYFKHNNIRSFIRQLNTYGFRKRTNISSTDEHLEFFHVSFRRDEPALLIQIKRCHQPKSQGQQQVSAVVGSAMGGMGAMGGSCGGGSGGGGGCGGCAGSGGGGGAQQSGHDLMDPSKQPNPDLDTIRNRVMELKTRLGSLQSEIMEYNQQMEQKVNLLMQILQTSSGSGGGSQLQQQLARIQAPGQMMGGSQNGGMYNPSMSMDNAIASFGGSLSSSASAQADLFGRRDSLLASFGQAQAGLGGMGSGLGGMAGLAGLPGLGMTGLGAGSFGGLASGLGGLGGFAGLGGLGAVGQKNGTDGGVGGVAGLQHLLEAAQRYQTEDTKMDNSNGHDQGRAKRFCTESARSEEARA